MGHEILINEINQLPETVGIKLNDDFVRTIQYLQLDIKLSQLIAFYEYIEYLCYDKILKNISKKAFVNLNKEQKEKIIKIY